MLSFKSFKDNFKKITAEKNVFIKRNFKKLLPSFRLTDQKSLD